MKITLARHGKPAPVESGWITSAQLRHWIRAYNESPLSEHSHPTDKLRKIAEKSNTILCSNLRRSIESARLLCGDRAVLQYDHLSEAGLPYTSSGQLRLPAKLWAALFRLYWLCGYSRNSESLSDSRTRARDAAKKLTQLAETDGPIIYVGHGIFNRLLARELLKSGWQGSRYPSSCYWGYTVYNKAES